jgi:hypothetical protein
LEFENLINLREHLTESEMFCRCNRIHNVFVGREVSEHYNYPQSDSDKFLVDEIRGWNRFDIARRRTSTSPRFGDSESRYSTISMAKLRTGSLSYIATQ